MLCTTPPRGWLLCTATNSLTMGPKRRVLVKRGPSESPPDVVAEANQQAQEAPGPQVAPAVAQQPDQRHPIASDDGDERTLNADFTKEFETTLQTLLDDPVYENIQTAPALSPAEGGVGAVFCQADFTRAMQNTGSYDFVGNLFFHDLRWRPIPASPINSKGITDIADHLYTTPPTWLNFTVVLAVDKDATDIAALAGSIKRVSPEEPVFALLRGAARATREEDKQQFRQLFRSVRYTCMHLTTQSMMLRESINIREELTTTFKAVVRTPLALLMMIVAEKKDLEKQVGAVTTQKLFQWFQQCRWSAHTEKLSKNLLENCSALWTKFTQEPTVLTTVRTAEQLWGSDTPFTSVLQMYIITLRAGKCPKKLRWLFHAILDAHRAGIVDLADLNVSRLQAKGRVTFLDLVLYKMDLLEELLGPQLSALPCTPSSVMKIRNIYKDHESFRIALGFKDAKQAQWTHQPNDLHWRHNLPKVENLFCMLVETVVYGRLHDSALRQGLKVGKTAMEMVHYSTLDVEIQRLHEETLKPAAKDDTAAALAAASLDATNTTGTDDGPDATPIFVDDEEAEARARWRHHAEELVRQRTNFIAQQPLAETTLRMMLSDTIPFKLTPPGTPLPPARLQRQDGGRMQDTAAYQTAREQATVHAHRHPSHVEGALQGVHARR